MHTARPTLPYQRKPGRAITRPLVLLLAVALTVPWAGALASDAVAPPGRYVVGFDELPDGLAADQPFWGGTVLAVDPVLRFATIAFPDGPPTALQASASIRYVELDAPIELLYTPNDPLWGDSGTYGPPMIGADAVWDHTLGTHDATVCIIDTGVRHTHEDLRGNYRGGIDYVDGDSDPYDLDGHGTHATGAATATVDNALGHTGVANVGYLSVRLVGSGGSSTSLATAIRWCADQGAAVISMSLLTGATTATDEAISYARSTGSILVAGAGNDGPCTDCVGYPASHPDVFAVGCVKSYYALCDWSSQGSELAFVAPGYGVLVPSYKDDTTYVRVAGTSYAAPFVAGAAALLRSAFPAATADQVRDALALTAEDLGDAGRDTSFGHGLVRVDLAYDHLEALLGGSPPPSGTPDLTVTALSVSPNTPTEGEVVSLTATVANQGTADAGPFTLRFLVDGSHLSDVSLASLAAGTTATYTRSWTSTAGDHVATARADPFAQVAETDEKNNALDTGFRVEAAPAPAPNEPPTALIAHACDGLSCTFDGRSSYDGDGSLAAYAWSFGDGTSGSGSLVSHTFAADGTYTVRLTITDDDGATDTTEVSLSVRAPELATVHVAGIAHATKGPHLEMTARIVDGTGAAVASASVTLKTCVGSTCQQFSGQTGADGLFTARWEKSPSGSTTTCATSVAKSGYKWDGNEACTTLETSSGGGGNGNGRK